ncbi:pilus assembly protein TadG-related protein [Spirillospora sp. CA-253888]
MSRLTRAGARALGALVRGLLRKDAAGDDGAVAVLVGVLLAGGVLLGSAALVLDAGQLHAEREELQSGADAAASAIAERCARTNGACGAVEEAARRYAGANAKDGTSAVGAVCGPSGRTDLPACPPASSNLTACLGDPPVANGWVEVRTHTRTPDGTTLLPPLFAATLLGNERYTGSTVRACARAAWGPPRRARGLGVTVSLCEWQSATAGGASFAPAPPQTPPASAEVVLRLHTTAPTRCAAGPSGGDSPGGFGWLDDLDGSCSTVVSADGAYGGTPGVAPSRACRRVVAAARADRRVTYLPIFRSVGGTGQNTTYTIAGFAPFVITGYGMPGASAPSSLTGARHCSGSDKCLYGYFTRALVPAGGQIGGPDLGATIVTLVG